MLSTPLALALVLAYLLGSLSFAVIVSRAMGLSDPRSYGSHNPGATNVLRSGQKGAAALTLLLDGAKGYVAVWAVSAWGEPHGLQAGSQALAALAAFAGHLWPVFFRFRGGKGVATAAGALLGLNPWLGLSTLLVWLVIAFFSRYSSLAALGAAAFAPLCQWLVWGAGPAAAAAAVMSVLLTWRHRSNIRDLLAGTEGRLDQKMASSAASTDISQPAASNERSRQ